MKPLLPFLVLALVFLLASGLVAWLGMAWSGRKSPGPRALSLRLRRMARQRASRQDTLIKPGTGQRLPGRAALAGLLLRAGSAHTPAQVMATSSVLWLLLALALGLALPWAGAALAALPAAALPLLRLLQLEQRRCRRFEDQLPDALDLMTRALRAGYGLSMSLGMVGKDMQEPLAGEFRQAFDQLNAGQGFGEALVAMTQRIRSRDLNFLVIALHIQRKTGGNLTELLVSLAKTMRERVKLRGRVRVLSSEGRLSGLLIGALPFVLACLLTLLNPGYMAGLWTTEAGRTVVLVGLGLLALGGLWMWKIVQIKV